MALQMRVNLPNEFELEDGVLTKDGTDWLEIFQDLLNKNGFTDFQVVRLRT